MQQYKYTFNGAINALLHNCRRNAKKRADNGRISAGIFNITYHDVLSLWKNQEGKCYHSGMPMNYTKNEWRISIDRIDNNRGYEKDNIVLCCLEFNTRKTWTETKINEMLDILNIGVEIDDKKENDYLPCLKRLLASSKTSNKTRTEKNRLTCDYQYDIDLKFLISLYIQQKGLCAYSGLPLALIKPMEGNWAMSVERKNIFKGYTKDNVCLICIEFNTADYGVVQFTTESGTSGFTKEKFVLFLAYLWLKRGIIKSENELEEILNLQKDTISREPKATIRTRTGVERLLKLNAEYKKLKTFGQILIVTSPHGIHYVFKSDCVGKSRNNVFRGIRRTGLAIMAQELEKYSEEDFTITPLLTCKRDQLEFYRQHFADIYESQVRKRPTTSNEIKKQIANTLIEINIDNRKGHDGRPLPKYVKYNKWKDREGYMIVNHPQCKKKSFTNQKFTQDQLYDICIDYLRQLRNLEDDDQNEK